MPRGCFARVVGEMSRDALFLFGMNVDGFISCGEVFLGFESILLYGGKRGGFGFVYVSRGWVLAKQLRCHECGGERGNKG
jgi:hypothetical protein